MSNHPLTAYREANNLTKAALAELLDVSRASITRWEAGKRKPDRDELVKITHRTGISARDLRPDLAEMLERAE